MEQRQGDATELPEGPVVLCHVVNSIGAWGAGFVLAISRRWPKVEKEYRAWARREGGKLPLGEVQIVAIGENRWVANMVGQEGVRSYGRRAPIRYPALGEALGKVADFAREKGAVVQFPPIGSGLAGGNWDEIAKLIHTEVEGRGVRAVLVAPLGWTSPGAREPSY